MNYFLFSLLLLLNYVVDAQVTTIPVTLFRQNYDNAVPGSGEYYTVTPCAESCAGYKWAKLSIALPENVQWDKNVPVVVAELSTCQYLFDSTCVFATNYIWSTNFFSVLMWDWTQYLDSTGSFYIRFTAPVASTQYSFQIQFEPDGSYAAGTFNYNAFRQSAVSESTTFNRLGQNALLYSNTVYNFETNNYFVQFCANELRNCNPNSFTLTATVQGTPDRAMSGFNLYACPWAYGSCDIYNYLIADLTATGVAQVVVTNAAGFNITKGVYFTIYGYGGEYNKENSYDLIMTLTGQ
jgi:hypothetical protein